MMGFRFLLLLLLLLGALILILAAESQICQNGMLYPAESIYEYYYCVRGELQHETCPGSSYFDANFLICRHGQPPAPSGNATASSGKCQRWGLAADLSDCSSFFHCEAKGADVERGSCAEGQIFDQSKFTCIVGQC